MLFMSVIRACLVSCEVTKGAGATKKKSSCVLRVLVCVSDLAFHRLLLLQTETRRGNVVRERVSWANKIC